MHATHASIGSPGSLTTLLGRARALVLAVAILLAGFAAVAPQIAQEAGASHTTVNVNSCFKYANGTAASGFNLQLYKWSGSSWVHYKSGKTGTNGCGTFYGVPGDAAYYFAASFQLKTYKATYNCTLIETWQKVTPYKWAPMYGTGYWGTYTVEFTKSGTC